MQVLKTCQVTGCGTRDPLASSIIPAMWQRFEKETRWRRGAALLAAVSSGLFAGRLLSEWLLPGLAGAILLTVLAVSVALLLWSRAAQGPQPPPIWPALLLLLYVFYPQPDPWIALAVGLLALLTQSQPLLSGRALPSWLAPTLVFLAATLLYGATVAPGVLSADNGELQLVAAELGVAHPPGFALYTMLAHLVTRLPLPLSAAVKVNLFSAVTSAATLALIYAGVYLLTQRQTAALVSTVALGSATTFWAQATTANIRSLTAFFAALAIYLLLLIRERSQERRAAEDDGGEPAPMAAGGLTFLLGLAVSLGVTHHASLFFMSMIFALSLLLFDPGLLQQPRRWLAPALGLSLGLAPLAYFPLRAMAEAPGAAAELATLPGFINHVLALGFRGDFFAFSEAVELGARLLVMGNVMLFQFQPLLLLGMALGLLLLLWQEWRVAVLLGGSLAIHTIVTATYRAPQTVEYMMPAYVPAVFLLAYGAGGLGQGVRAMRAERFCQPLRHLLTALLLLVAGAQLIQRLPDFRALHGDRTAGDYAETVLNGAPAGSVILADWHWATPLWYLQEVEGVRPELDVRYVFPTAERYVETWARRIGELLAAERPVVATHFDEASYEALPPPEPLGEAFLFRQETRRELPPGFAGLEIRLGEEAGNAIELLGYRLEAEAVRPTEEVAVTLAWQPGSPLEAPVSLFAHLVGSDGGLYAQEDLVVRPQAEGISLTRFHLTPRPEAAPGAYSLQIGAYDSSSGTPLLGAEGEARVELATVQVALLERRLYTQHRAYRPLAEGHRRLVGHDWDNTLEEQPRLYLHWQTQEGHLTEVQDGITDSYLLPPWRGPWGLTVEGTRLARPEGEFYVPLGQGIVWLGEPQLRSLSSLIPGERLALTQFFGASRPVLQDWVVSVRLIGYEEDGFQWAWVDLQDGIPALGAIPTLKWIGNSWVRDPHRMTVAETAYPEQEVGGVVRLYDAFTNRVLPILDERIIQEFLGLPLDQTTVTAP